MKTIYVVVKSETWEGQNNDRVLGAYHKREDAVAEVKKQAEKRKPEWDGDEIEESEDTFCAWREDEYDYYHCEIYIEETTLE